MFFLEVGSGLGSSFWFEIGLRDTVRVHVSYRLRLGMRPRFVLARGWG